MTPRRKRLHLTIAEKYEILMMIEKGEPQRVIMKKYNVPRSTFYNIYRHREEIKKQFQISTLAFSRSTRRVSLGRSADVDTVLIHWYLRCKERNVEITGADIRRKALEINEKLNGHPGFKASYIWFVHFKERYRITSADIREDLPIEIEFAEVEAFTTDFMKLLQENGFRLKNVYNAVYTEMMWTAVPENTSILNSAKLTGNLQMCEDYVTVLFCANATGCHKLPVLIIGNVPETQSLYNFNTKAFSTIYRSKTNVCMDSTIFTRWYKEHFLESIKERQRENGRREKYLLLLDNARSFHDLDDLNDIDPFVTVMSPPLPVSTLMQPMNCGIITCFKRKYRKELVETITPLTTYNTEDEVIDLHTELSMWDCCRIIHDAWSYVEDAILINSWDNLLRPKNIRSMKNTESWKADELKTLELLHDLPGCELCDEIDVSNWFHIDSGYDVIMRVCTDQVLREFRNNTLGQLNIDIIDDQAESSHS